MKTKIWMSLTAIAALSALTIPAQLAAQHTRFKLIDMGTLGGPNGGLSGPGLQVINNRGASAAWANTSTANPNSGCYIDFGPPDCFVEQPLVWQNGIVSVLPVLPGGANGSANSISSSGLIAGDTENGLIDPMTGLPEGHAVLWTKDGGITDLGTIPGGTESLATSANSRGQVVGFANNDVTDAFSLAGFPTQTRAFLWQNGALRDLGTLGGPDALANGINERGQVAGFSYTSTLALDPFLWEHGAMIDLGNLGGTFGSENWLNNRGQVVGNMNLAGDVNYHGFLWDRGYLLDLGTLGGNDSEANWISDSGLVVGRADIPGSQTHHAFLWNNHAMSDLGVIAPWPCSTALSVNSMAQVVGDTGICGEGGGPAFFSENGQPVVDINTLVLGGSDLEVVEPYDINERGEIAATAILPSGDQHGVVLVPASEDEIAAASARGISQSTPTTVHGIVRNSENSPFRGYDRARNIFRKTPRQP